MTTSEAIHKKILQ